MCDVSIVIPYYNSKNTIIKAVNSVQKIKDIAIEIIIINDGSELSHLPILKNLDSEYSNVKVIHKKNGGVSSARNCGINNSIGNYILFLDADDILLDALNKKTLYILKQKDANIIVGNRETKIVSTNSTKKYYGYENDKMDVEKFIEYSLSKSIVYWNLGGYIVKKSFLDNNSLRFNENIQSAEDLDFFSSILNNTESVYTSKNIFFKYNFGYDQSASMTITKKKIKDQLFIYENLVDKYKNNKYIVKYFSSSLLKVFNEIELLENNKKNDMYEEIDFKLKKISEYKFKYYIFFFIMKIFGVKKGNYYIYKIKELVK